MCTYLYTRFTKSWISTNLNIVGHLIKRNAVSTSSRNSESVWEDSPIRNKTAPFVAWEISCGLGGNPSPFWDHYQLHQSAPIQRNKIVPPNPNPSIFSKSVVLPWKLHSHITVVSYLLLVKPKHPGHHCSYLQHAASHRRVATKKTRLRQWCNPCEAGAAGSSSPNRDCHGQNLRPKKCQGRD